MNCRPFTVRRPDLLARKFNLTFRPPPLNGSMHNILGPSLLLRDSGSQPINQLHGVPAWECIGFYQVKRRVHPLPLFQLNQKVQIKGTLNLT